MGHVPRSQFGETMLFLLVHHIGDLEEQNKTFTDTKKQQDKMAKPFVMKDRDFAILLSNFKDVMAATTIPNLNRTAGQS